MSVTILNIPNGIAVEHRHQCSVWRPQATYMDSMRGIADISSPEHDLPASRGSCNVHLSWQQQRTGRKSMMTVCGTWLNISGCISEVPVTYYIRSIPDFEVPCRLPCTCNPGHDCWQLLHARRRLERLMRRVWPCRCPSPRNTGRACGPSWRAQTARCGRWCSGGRALPS